jgi:hypothetical protein
LQELLNLLKLHKDKLERYCSIINLQREIETLAITIKHLQSGTDIHTISVPQGPNF